MLRFDPRRRGQIDKKRILPIFSTARDDPLLLREFDIQYFESIAMYFYWENEKKKTNNNELAYVHV